MPVGTGCPHTSLVQFFAPATLHPARTPRGGPARTLAPRAVRRPGPTGESMKKTLLPKTFPMLALTMLGIAGCEPPPPDAAAPTGARTQPQESFNGLSFNGLSFNGLSFNGLSFNGLSFNGLSSEAFNTWFQTNPSLADMAMRYVVRCAVPAGQTRTYTEPAMEQSYTWEGGLGLAPDWASGSPATLAEQQVVSACLAAHANRLGEELLISILGLDGAGAVIPYTAQELATHSRQESCFFGNLFTSEGVHVGAERAPLSPQESTSRACAGLLHDGTETRVPCAPMVYVGACTSHCTLDSSGLYYETCTLGGVTYRPITTRLSPTNVNVCGDSVCQATEQCGTSNRYDSCAQDCGPCP
ncbi:hypothetical protein BHS06_28810 [Myxococcus xanthus]|uniref:hypothetical protein n=1 Tax=Myxococcus xanthus TaxID=34 RepID=UPI00112A9A49|nr:hypothetical protein BHS06_28810 [Myxococcus xanthus]